MSTRTNTEQAALVAETRAMFTADELEWMKLFDTAQMTWSVNTNVLPKEKRIEFTVWSDSAVQKIHSYFQSTPRMGVRHSGCSRVEQGYWVRLLIVTWRGGVPTSALSSIVVRAAQHPRKVSLE